MTAAERRQHLVGFLTAVWSFSILLESFLTNLNARQPGVRFTLTDDGASSEVFAGSFDERGSITAQPLRQVLDPDRVFAEEAYPSKFSELLEMSFSL